MRKRNIGFVAAALLAAGCTSINPVPPQAPGTDWTRYELAQGATPNERRSPRVKVSGRSNLTGPRLLAGETFRYRVDLNVEDGLSKVALTCLQGSDPAEFRCGDDRSAFMALALPDHCESGSLSSGGRAYAVKNWFSKATHVGFFWSATVSALSAQSTPTIHGQCRCGQRSASTERSSSRSMFLHT